VHEEVSLESVLNAQATQRVDGWKIDEKTGFVTAQEETELSVQRNGITFIGERALFGFANLVRLDLSRNSLTRLDGLDVLEKLEVLSVYLNKLQEGAELLKLEKNALLRSLDVRLNPVTRSKLYKMFVIQHLKGLEVLDETKIVAHERRKAGELPIISVEDLFASEDDDDDEDDDVAEISLKTRAISNISTKNREPEVLDASEERENLNESFLNHETEASKDSVMRVPNKDEEDEEEEEEVTTEEALLRLLNFVRKMKMPIRKSEWDDIVAGINQRLVKIVHCRKQEKRDIDYDKRIRRELQVELKERSEKCSLLDKQLADASHYEKMLFKAEDVIGTLREEKKRLENVVNDLRSRCDSLEQDALKSQKKGQKTTSLMLQESHERLIGTNRALLEELQELKIQYKTDELQWRANFNMLKDMQSHQRRQS